MIDVTKKKSTEVAKIIQKYAANGVYAAVKWVNKRAYIVEYK